MRLRDLEAYFVGRYKRGKRETYRRLRSVEGAQGVIFLCPKCFQINGGSIGTHSVLCWFLNPRNAPPVPADTHPLPGRWQFAGDTIDELTFTGPAAASVLLQNPAGCQWHGFIRNGEATLS